MRLYREDRDKLYGTDVVSEQILSFLTSRPTRSCLAKELREIFFDVSAGYFFSSLLSLKSRGYIKEEGIEIRLCKAAPKDNTRDQIWNATRILKQFSSLDIAELLPELQYKNINKVLRSWELSDELVVIAEGPPKIYASKGTNAIRPVNLDIGEKNNRLAGDLWMKASLLQTFSEEDLLGSDITADFIHKNVNLWLQHKMISKEGSLYEVISDAYKDYSKAKKTSTLSESIPEHLDTKISNIKRISEIKAMREYITAEAKNAYRSELEMITKELKEVLHDRWY